MNEPTWVSGDKLHPEDKKQVLRTYVHRFTGNNKPAWTNKLRPDGSAYHVQFKDDEDWLANTEFATRQDGRLDNRFHKCYSCPTWPEGK